MVINVPGRWRVGSQLLRSPSWCCSQEGGVWVQEGVVCVPRGLILVVGASPSFPGLDGTFSARVVLPRVAADLLGPCVVLMPKYLL